MLFKATLTLAVISSCLLCDQGAVAGAGIDPLTTVRVASGLNRPIFVTHAPGDSTRLFIVEQRGVIKILDLVDGTVLATPFLDIDAIVPAAIAFLPVAFRLSYGQRTVEAVLRVGIVRQVAAKAALTRRPREQ